MADGDWDKDIEMSEFDTILGRMLSAPPLTKAQISARVLKERSAKFAEKLKAKRVDPAKYRKPKPVREMDKP